MKRPVCIILMSLILFGIIGFEFYQTEKNLSSNILRLHIVANSNSCNDQRIKLKVRDTILEKMSKELSSFSDASEAKRNVKNKLKKIENITRDVLINEGVNDKVSVSLENTFFPTKKYNDITLPKGRYDAVNIRIGEAGGQNWWCVMFPPLCFVDCNDGKINTSDKNKLNEKLNEKDNRLISSKDNKVKIRFKLYEIWQDSKEAVMSAFN